MKVFVWFLSLLSTLSPQGGSALRNRPTATPRASAAMRQLSPRGGRDESSSLPASSISARSDPLEIATDEYYWKPMTGFFRAFELRAYRETGVRLNDPVLDLGCSDGTFARMISRLLGPIDNLIGADLNLSTLREAQFSADRRHRALVAAEALKLPLSDDAFGAVLANGVLNCCSGDMVPILREIARVLRPHGQFVATVHTREFGRNYWMNRLARRLGFHRLGEMHRAGLDRRMDHVQSLTCDEWVQSFEAAGLKVERVTGFCPPEVTVRWSLIAATPLRAHGILKFLPVPVVHRAVSWVHKRLFASFYRVTPAACRPEDSGYILIQARKKT